MQDTGIIRLDHLNRDNPEIVHVSRTDFNLRFIDLSFSTDINAFKVASEVLNQFTAFEEYKGKILSFVPMTFEQARILNLS